MKYEIETIKVKLKVKACAEPEQKVTQPGEAVKIARAIFAELDADQEHFVILALSAGNQIVGFKPCFSGGQAETGVYAEIVFRNALLMGARNIILVHNHPSGRTEPSREDIEITRKLKSAGDILNVRVLDHLILGEGDSYLSMTEQRII